MNDDPAEALDEQTTARTAIGRTPPPSRALRGVVGDTPARSAPVTSP
jgi:hypothetical protein